MWTAGQTKDQTGQEHDQTIQASGRPRSFRHGGRVALSDGRICGGNRCARQGVYRGIQEERQRRRGIPAASVRLPRVPEGIQGRRRHRRRNRRRRIAYR